jgi:hypothetical protein
MRDIDIGVSATECGRNTYGPIKMDSATLLAFAQKRNGLPICTRGEVVQMTVHQINIDGGGPFTCELSPSAGAVKDWIPIRVVENTPGTSGNYASGTVMDYPLTVEIPAGLPACPTAGNCMVMVRCKTGAVAGPFGGCMPIYLA